jgi:hypothetical protein
MYSEFNLLTLLGAPVIAYLAAALIFAFIEIKEKDQSLPDSETNNSF